MHVRILYYATLLAAAASLGSTGTSTASTASGNLGVYAIVERVQFEPNEREPQRLRVYGAFSFVNGGVSRPADVTEAKRGFLYFRLPTQTAPNVNVAATRREWTDIKAVAGSGQAIAFGEWFYLGQFASFVPDGSGRTAPQVLTSQPNNVGTMRVHAERDTMPEPVLYMTNVGVIKLTEASHAAVIARLRAALR
jgi:hypothetical protein